MHEFAPNLTKKPQQKTSGFHGFADVKNGRKTGWKTAENKKVVCDATKRNKRRQSDKNGTKGLVIGARRAI